MIRALWLVGVMLLGAAPAVAQTDAPPATVGEKARMPASLHQAILAAADNTPTTGKAAEIPAGIYALLQSGPERFADAGGSYNLGDVVIGPPPHLFARIVWAGRVGDFYLLATEHGGMGSGASVQAFAIEPSGRPKMLWSAYTYARQPRVEPLAVNAYRSFADFRAAVAADEVKGAQLGPIACDALLTSKSMQFFFRQDGSPAPVKTTVPESIMPILAANTVGERPAALPASAAAPPRVLWAVKLEDAYVVQYDSPMTSRPFMTIAYDPPKDVRKGWWTGRVKAFDSYDAFLDEARRSMTPAMEYKIRHRDCPNH